jgi:putative two-component system response regulator
MDKEIVLIVEDNSDMRSGLKSILSFEGYRVHTAAHGAEALKLLETLLPDLIISDISMPVMDGFTLFKHVRSRPAWVTIPFIFLTVRGEREDQIAGRGLGADDYLVKPLSRDELLTAVRARLSRLRQLQMAQLHQAYQHTLTMLATAIEVRDQYTRGHIERVTEYALLLGELSGLSPTHLEGLRLGAILHDIGKIHVQESILSKKNGLTPEEWLEIKKHPITGAELVREIPYLTPAIPVIRYHHERWDGSGYPFGLQGENIPLEARLVAVADSFDAMTTDRPYKRGLTHEEGLTEIVRCSGSLYDPKVVDCFKKAWETGQIQRIAREFKTGKLKPLMA